MHLPGERAIDQRITASTAAASDKRSRPGIGFVASAPVTGATAAGSRRTAPSSTSTAAASATANSGYRRRSTNSLAFMIAVRIRADFSVGASQQWIKRLGLDRR